MPCALIWHVNVSISSKSTKFILHLTSLFWVDLQLLKPQLTLLSLQRNLHTPYCFRGSISLDACQPFRIPFSFLLISKSQYWRSPYLQSIVFFLQSILISAILAVCALSGLTSLLETWLAASLKALVTCDTGAIGIVTDAVVSDGASCATRSITNNSTPSGRMVVNRFRLNFCS